MWYFRSPLIVFGEDALSHLEQNICSRVFIVTDAVMQELGHLQYVIDRLSGCGVACDFFAEVEPDPGVEIVQALCCADASFRSGLGDRPGRRLLPGRGQGRLVLVRASGCGFGGCHAV